MNQLQAQRLLNVASVLREAPRSPTFTMECYGHNCGTPCCALGHYAVRRDVQRTYSLDWSGDLRLDSDNTQHSFCGLGLYSHFGIDRGECSTLFEFDGCDDAKTPVEAARFIERFLKDKGWIPD